MMDMAFVTTAGCAHSQSRSAVGLKMMGAAESRRAVLQQGARPDLLAPRLVPPSSLLARREGEDASGREKAGSKLVR
jgi:hypothetical protein